MVSRRAFIRGAAALQALSAASCVPALRTAGSGAPVDGTGRATRSPGPPVALEFWLPGSQADAQALQPFHAQFAAETPRISGVNVRLVTNETMMPEVAAALAAGTPPDVARLKEYRLADLGVRDALLALDGRVARDPAVRLTDFTPQSVEGSRAPGRSPRGGQSLRPLLGRRKPHNAPIWGMPASWSAPLVRIARNRSATSAPACSCR